MLTLRSITQIATSRADLYAFRVTAEVSREDMTAMAEYMNRVFDKKDGVDMLLIFDRYDGAETGATLSWEGLKSRLRAVANVNRYVVVGAPESAEALIEAMGALIPVEAQTYDEEFAAWRALDAEAVAA
ncbi:STAS/SEC14 domain-containing protein [Marimonas sp. MJW-29]|uniref:STAS/SEC14 domain-containing protein n=1 Tax=Sulfitobacter sediminis TaxID=3234186 RepID=A0ABV3RJ19_9RHOB